MKRKRPKKRVEYRWFVATPTLGLCGGIVAADRAEAEMWGARELYAKHDGAELIRVRLEYTK